MLIFLLLFYFNFFNPRKYHTLLKSVCVWVPPFLCKNFSKMLIIVEFICNTCLITDRNKKNCILTMCRNVFPVISVVYKRN